MLSRLFGRKPPEARIAATLYGAIVAQAREPALYARLGVPDTVSGRFEMLVLHVFLVVRRLRDGGSEGDAIGQAVFDTFCTDMDRSLRELGIGDLGVPRRMRQMGEAFYGRARAYGEAVDAGDEAALAASLCRNVLKNRGDRQAAIPLARYTLAAATDLGRVPSLSLIDGLSFPLPERFMDAGHAADAVA
jgi:cytochrome b pre-mRNA-processing protein 3